MPGVESRTASALYGLGPNIPGDPLLPSPLKDEASNAFQILFPFALFADHARRRVAHALQFFRDSLSSSRPSRNGSYRLFRSRCASVAVEPKTVESRCGAVTVGPSIAVAAPFGWRCPMSQTMAPFPHPAHRTGHADFPHPALGQDITPSPTTRRASSWSDARARSARGGARVDRSRLCAA